MRAMPFFELSKDTSVIDERSKIEQTNVTKKEWTVNQKTERLPGFFL
jgi:hypothetical protein